MGYRSQVAYWFRGKAAQAVVMEHMQEHPRQECFDELTITEDGVYFEATGTKWYAGYESVDWHTALYALAESHEEDGELSGQFVRIGEDDNDIDTQYFGEPWEHTECIHVVRELEYDFPDLPVKDEITTNQKEK